MERGATRLIHDGPHMQALVREGSSAYVLVTFNGLAFHADGKRIWAQPVADALDLNAVGFVAKGSSWFPEVDLAAAFASALSFIERFQERIGYGYSQGGYGAIKASRPLGLTRTIVVSPQFSIDPDDIVDGRFNRFFDTAINRGMAITDGDAPASLTILYDPELPVDGQHVRNIQAVVPDATVISVPFTGHDTMRAIRGTESFQALIASLNDGSAAATVSRLRRASPVRHETMIHRAVKKQQFARALAIIDAPQLSDEGRAAAFLLFAQQGNCDAVLRRAHRHAAARPKDAMAWAVYAYALAKSMKPRRAKDAAKRSLALRGSNRARRIAEQAIAQCDQKADS